MSLVSHSVTSLRTCEKTLANFSDLRTKYSLTETNKVTYIAWCYTGAVYAVVVYPSVCLSQAGTVPKQLTQTMLYDSPGTLNWFSGAKYQSKIRTRYTLNGGAK